MEKRVFIVDGSSFMYRAYYAMKPMTSSKGVPVGAVYGFCRMIKKLITKFMPSYLILTWDSAGETERHQILPTYKSTRQAPPSDLWIQKEMIQEFARLIGMKQVQQSGVEADDLMFSLAQDFVKQGFSTVLVTTDKDLGQMVDKQVVVYDPFKEEFVDRQAFEQKYGFPPSKLAFYFALVGDASDNIPGVAGIGPKGATDLVKQFETLHDLYEHIDQVPKERTRSLLLASKEKAFISEQLFLLRYHDLGIQPEDGSFDPAGWNHAYPLFEELDFKSLIKDMTPPSQEIFLSQKHGFTFSAIMTEQELNRVCQAVRDRGVCALDTEATSLYAYQAHLTGISLCYETGTAFYIPLGHKGLPGQLSKAAIMAILKPVLEDATIKKYLHNTKYDQLVLSRYGIELANVSVDTLIAANLVTPDSQRIGLKPLSATYLNQKMLTYQEVMQHGDFTYFGDVPLELAVEYAASDAHQTWQLVPLLQQKLQEYDQTELFYSIEMPLSQTLYRMEKEGVICDTSVLAVINTHVEQALERIRQDIVTILGPDYKNINLNSPKQIEEVLFVTLQLTPTKKTSKKTGYSTDQEVLSELAQHHPIPALLLKYRELFKIKSTYLDALPEYINRSTGRIHTSFSQTVTATGRLASSDPNLQNIPVAPVVGDLSIRSAFKAPHGQLFISADYSHIELRVLAYYSGDTRLTQAFLRNEDIHRLTAAGLFDIAPADVSHDQRQLGKRINFSILYGVTPYGLSKDLGISYSDAELYIEKFFAQYPQVSAWIAQVIEETKERGYVTTVWGHRRYIPGIYEKNKTLYDAAVRIAVNTKAQGTAADIIKIGMNRLDELFRATDLGARMVLQIHDELLITAPEHSVAQTQQLVVKTLQDVVQWPVPLVVTTRIGHDWHEVTK